MPASLRDLITDADGGPEAGPAVFPPSPGSRILASGFRLLRRSTESLPAGLGGDVPCLTCRGDGTIMEAAGPAIPFCLLDMNRGGRLRSPQSSCKNDKNASPGEKQDKHEDSRTADHPRGTRSGQPSDDRPPGHGDH